MTSRDHKPVPLSCDLYDYIEIACLFGYDVRLSLTDGSIHEGKALTTKTESGSEYICLQVEGETVDVALAAMQRMTVLTKGARFEHVNFQ